MIERNKHAAGRICNIIFGLATVADGLVRVLSLGFLHTKLPIEFSRIQVRRIHIRHIKKTQKAIRQQENLHDRLTKGL